MFHKHILLLIVALFSVAAISAATDTLSIQIIIQDAVAVDEIFIPIEYALYPPYPNPFNPDVNLLVDIPQQDRVYISILNVRGQEIAILENREIAPGRYEYHWRGVNYASGIYFARIQSSHFSKSIKISLLK